MQQKYALSEFFLRIRFYWSFITTVEFCPTLITPLGSFLLIPTPTDLTHSLSPSSSRSSSSCVKNNAMVFLRNRVWNSALTRAFRYCTVKLARAKLPANAGNFT